MCFEESLIWGSFFIAGICGMESAEYPFDGLVRSVMCGKKQSMCQQWTV